MSFEFRWPRYFSASFYESAKNSLEQALNSGQKLSLVADRIRVVDLNLGTIPPELDLLAIEELSAVDGSFKGRFMLSYSGDAFISLATNLHVNPLTQYKHALEMLATPSVLLTTAEMFVQLTLSHLRLRCVISLAFSKTNGLAMIFRDDPLESLNVSSSFDSFGVVQQFIQSEIENQLRERFRRDLPSLIHRLSQKWCADMAQQAASGSHTAIVVEQVIHTPVSEDGLPSNREPDDSLPHDYGRQNQQESPRRVSFPFHASPSKSQLELQDTSGSVPGAIAIVQSDDVRSEVYDGREGETQQKSFEDHACTDLFSGGDRGHDHDDAYPTAASVPSQPSSWSSTWSRDTSARSEYSSSSPDKSWSSNTGATQSSTGNAGPESSIISSLKRSTSNFATTFSKPPVPVSAEDLHKTLDVSNPHAGARQTIQQRESHSRERRQSDSHLHANNINNKTSEQRVPFATRKRLHRLEGTTPRTTPNSSPQKARTLKGAKSRDRLRVHREDLDEYFPVTEEGSSTTTARNDSVFGSGLSQRPSLLNPDVPMQIPMAAGLLQSSKSDFASKNSLRRTIMSSRLRDLERFSASGPPSTRRQHVNKDFFTANQYS